MACKDIKINEDEEEEEEEEGRKLSSFLHALFWSSKNIKE